MVGSVLVAMGAGALSLLAAATVERERVQLDRYRVQLNSRHLPSHGLTILHLSDFHFKADGLVQARKIANLQALLAQEHYDVVSLTGDLIHDIDGLPAALALIESLRPRYGLYFVPGNHDYAEYTPWGVFGHTWRESADGDTGARDWLQVVGALLEFAGKVARNDLVRMPVRFNDVPGILHQLSAIGVQPLVNEPARLTADGVDVWFSGVDDALEGRCDLAAALGDIPAGAPLVLLAHNPDIWLQDGVDRADLVLSGHTHGGQIQLPVMGAVHTQGTHLRRGQPAGWFERGTSRMFVSRGLGESIPLRFRARPQATLIHLVGSK